MADIGMGGNIAQNLRTERLKESDKTNKTDRKDQVKERESMAGATQVEGKFKKEEVTKSEEKYKAFKRASEYMLGDHPQDIEEELDAEEVNKKEKTEKTPEKKEPTLDEIENYEIRERFKSKVKLLLGDDFNEEEEYSEEELISDEKLEDNKYKSDFAKKAYSTLIQYIRDALGEFDFDNLEDIKLLSNNGMPEDAILKFIFLHQMARSDEFFPNVTDMSIIMYKIKNLGIEKSQDEIFELINNDYETYKKLKYTLAGFVYIPLQEVLDKAEEEIRVKYYIEFQKLSDNFNIEKTPHTAQKLTKSVVLKLKESLDFYNNQILELRKEYEQIENSLERIVLKNKIQENKDKVKEISIKISEIENILELEQIKVTLLVIIHTFYLLNQKICDFNKDYPIDMISGILSYISVNLDSHKVIELLNKNFSFHILDILNKKEKDFMKRSTEVYDTRIKASNLNLSKLPTSKQQSILKTISGNTFEIASQLYWLKQKNLNTLSELIDRK